MKARIADRIYLTGLTSEQSRRIKKILTFRNPKKDAAKQFGHASWNIPATLELFEETDNGLIVPRGVGHCADEVDDERHSHPVKIKTSIETRGYQERAIRLALNKGDGLIVAPTGAGKTTMGIELAARLGQRCLILVKSLDLAKQWQGAVKQFTGLECGLIGGGKIKEGKEFTVGLVQTLVKHPESLDYGLVICDECHNIPAIQAYSVINHQAAKYRFGLSATPQRRDNLEMMIHAALGPVVAEVEEREVEGSILPVTVSILRYDFLGNPES
jgi:superfamily II DNA or RNA helicase